jgi:hypothetical protein
MAANPSYMFAGLAGSPTALELCWVADAAGAVLPTNESTALDTTFKSIGLVTQDGATTSTAITQNDVASFGSYAPTRTLITSEVQTVHFIAQETNKVVAAVRTRQALSAITVTTGKMSLTRGAARDALYALVVDAGDGANKIRKVYPRARLTNLGDQQISFATPVQYDFTFTAYLDGTGNSEYEYVNIVGLI